MKLMKYLLLFILFSLSHTTNRNIIEDHHTIQKGINTSSDYDVVLISERNNYENITFEREKPVVRPLFIMMMIYQIYPKQFVLLILLKFQSK